MPKLVERIDEKLKVESYSFMVMDEDGAAKRPDDAPSMDDLLERLRRTDVWFVAAANLAFVESADDWHVVEVALEKWDGEPPSDDEDWTKTCTAEMYSSSGRLALVQTLGNPARKLLGSPGDGRGVDRSRELPPRTRQAQGRAEAAHRNRVVSIPVLASARLRRTMSWPTGRNLIVRG